jgi:hypothetical protein
MKEVEKGDDVGSEARISKQHFGIQFVPHRERFAEAKCFMLFRGKVSRCEDPATNVMYMCV